MSNTHSGKLVIVESPAKARTVGRFLGGGYDVRASVGHVRDLLRSKLSVDLEHDFEPTYRVPNEKRGVVKALKSAAARAKEIYLATDPDREGEAIAWHLLEAAEIPPERTRRVVFHEITRHAIADAFAHSRDIDMQLVDAQQARRILDRLVGYQISPLLWDRVKSRLSAGRVQSVALRLIVEREREILAFVPVEYWSIDAELAQQTTRTQQPRPGFRARLVRIRGAEADLKARADADQVVADLRDAAYDVAGVKRGERRRRPYAPFTTSTLQQDAAQRLGMTAARAMRVAQDLYEGIDLERSDGNEEGPIGLITYMRTDSVNVAQEAVAEARALITETYGPEYLPAKPNVYRSRAKNAQEAHEAIRPTSSQRTPSMLRDKLKRDQYRLYELIWQRFVASQMAAAVYDTVTVEVEAGQPGALDRPYLFRASGSAIKFPGFLAVYSGGAAGPTNGGANGILNDDGRPAGAAGGNGRDGSAVDERDAMDESAGLTGQEILPELRQGEPLDLLRLIPEQHFTQPSPRYSEASLVKTLEENGIGRPSTYAAIISTILDRGYVERADKRLAPTDLGCTVNDLLVKHFDSLFNVGFTAGMEEHLDSIASGTEEMAPVLRDFYDFFSPQLREAERTMARVVVAPEKTGEVCPECGGDLVIKLGRYGKFVGCASYPTCRFTKPLIIKIGVACPKDGGDLAERRSRRGRTFYGCANYPECDFTSWKRPIPQPCPRCGGLLVVANKVWAECIACHERTRVEFEGA
ncbi:MAG: type I DNA topoisomerase [Chloroflexi bacterium HGW-Chloroflexi-1]|nr:MAG: type I DNA topoisomerase [Chloroflexi bacterium HGW-Chloroflexi-1]